MKRPVFNTPRMGVPGASSTDVCMYNDACENPPSEQFDIAVCDGHAHFIFDRMTAFLALDELRNIIAERHAATRRDIVVRRRAEALIHGHITAGNSSEQPGYVYVIRFGGMVKIGFSTNPAQRIKNLPHEEVLAVRPGSRKDERTAHGLCANWRVMGEWFEDCPELRQTLQLDTPKAM